MLIGVRDVLRKQNLFDTTSQPAVNTPPVEPYDGHVLTQRTPDGTYNDLENPAMGMAESRFGRNVPIDHTFPEAGADLLTPSPREISRTVMTRDQLIAATSCNALAASWLQFQIRDWFSHGKSPDREPHRDPAGARTTPGPRTP